MSQNGVEETEIHLRDYIEVLKRHVPLFFMLFIPVFSAAAVYTFIQSPVYESTLMLEVLTPQQMQVNGADNSITAHMSVETVFQKLTGKKLLNNVAKALQRLYGFIQGK